MPERTLSLPRCWLEIVEESLNHQANFPASTRPQFTPQTPHTHIPELAATASHNPNSLPSEALLSHSHIWLIKRHILERRSRISFSTSCPFLSKVSLPISVISTLVYPGSATSTSTPRHCCVAVGIGQADIGGKWNLLRILGSTLLNNSGNSFLGVISPIFS